MELKILKAGDKVISVTDKVIAIEHLSGEISLLFYVMKKGKPKIKKKAVITHEDEIDVVYSESNRGLEVIHF
ncbi:MAG: hypothetical protein GX757_13255 [Clostridiales bacterium]|nr:hypothetical protein [Clostridiales bacterium]